MLELAIDLLIICIAFYTASKLCSINKDKKNLSPTNVAYVKDDFIKTKVLPYYTFLEEKYNAKYPCVMHRSQSTVCDLSHKNHQPNFYFFIFDDEFVVIDSTNEEIKLSINFNSIVYHHCFHLTFDYGRNYYFEFYFNYRGKTQELLFCMPDYNPKLDYTYPLQKNYTLLYSFITKNFINKKEYYRTH